MATIRLRRRRDGKLAYQAEVRIKRNGRLVHRESKTFDRRRLATEWAPRLEDRLSKPAAVPKRNQLTFRHPIFAYRMLCSHELDEMPKTFFP